MQVLAALSSSCSQRLRSRLLDTITTPGTGVGRGVWETYARLLFLGPRASSGSVALTGGGGWAHDDGGVGITCLCSKLEHLMQTQTVHSQFNVLEMVDLRLLRLLQRQFAHGGGATARGVAASTMQQQVRRLWRHWQHVSAQTGAAAVQPNAARLDRVFFEVFGFLCRLREYSDSTITLLPSLLLLLLLL